MSFGIVAGAVAGPLIGGLLGGSDDGGGSQTQTTQQKLDPRMEKYIYGADGNAGLLGSAFDLTQQQLKTDGLNDLQRQGLDMQRQYLMSPQYQQGFSGMMGLGQQLMGGGVAGNPFNKSGGVAANPYNMGGSGGQANPSAPQPFAYSGSQNAMLPSFNMQPLTMPESISEKPPMQSEDELTLAEMLAQYRRQQENYKENYNRP